MLDRTSEMFTTEVTRVTISYRRSGNCIQGSHKLWKSWKTWKITKKSAMHGKNIGFEKT